MLVLFNRLLMYMEIDMGYALKWANKIKVFGKFLKSLPILVETLEVFMRIFTKKNSMKKKSRSNKKSIIFSKTLLKHSQLKNTQKHIFHQFQR